MKCWSWFVVLRTTAVFCCLTTAGNLTSFIYIFISSVHPLRSLGRDCEDAVHETTSYSHSFNQQGSKQASKVLFSSNTEATNLRNIGIYQLLSFSLMTMDFTIERFPFPIALEILGEMLIFLDIFDMSLQSGSSEEKLK